MRVTLVSGVICLSILAGCGGGVGSNIRGDDDHIAVCQQQSDWARLGTVPTGYIAISCPEHGIGDYR